MTLAELNALTADLPGETEICFLHEWGELESTALLTADDLADGDPVLELMATMKPGTIILTGEAA
jgi:hypothetical protein